MIIALVEGCLSALCGKLNDVVLSSLFDYLGALWLSIIAIIRTPETAARMASFHVSIDELHKDLRDTEPTNSESQEWLDQVEDLAYDMEDVLDDYETMQRQCSGRSWISVLPIYLKHYKVFAEANTIMGRLQELNKRKEELSPLITNAIVGTSLPTRPPEGFTSAEILYGRESEMTEIVDLLLRPNGSTQIYDVIPIVGMGGLGKTALAQHVFKDNKVVSSFEVMAWSCASMDFDRCRIFGSIMKQLMTSCDAFDLCVLEKQVQEKFKNKKFLVVLDDVWPKSKTELNRFLAPFKVAAPGSKFIITTRDGNMAKYIMTVERPVELKLLSEEDCWSLFCAHSRLETSMNSRSELVKIGQEISEKCGGLPLAAAVLGSLLRGVDSEETWRSVLSDKSLIFKQGKYEIDSVLKLSYDKLQYCVKHCFAFCTIFREDYLFSKENLVNYWRSAGLIKCGRDGKDWKEVGGGYFDELVSRCFPLYKENEAYVMHDLIRDMGQEVCGDRYYGESQTKTKSISWEKVRHAALESSKLMDCVEFERKKEISLRSLIMRNRDASIQKDMDLTLYLKIRKLRRLNLQNLKTTQISNCLGELKHLRYFRIECEKLTELPSEIGSLSSLCELDISKCQELTKLPGEIKNFTNLSKLCIWDCPGLTELPSEIGSLSSLCELYIDNCQGLTKLPSEIKKLTNLSILVIWNCPGLTELPSEIGNLSSLCEVNIGNCQGLTKLLWEIKKLTNISELRIWTCSGLIELPSEIGSLSNLSKLFICHCPKLTDLPSEIGNLSSLCKLVIQDCQELTKLPWEIKSLTKLSELEIWRCPGLTELPSEIGSLSNLYKLIIYDCPKLTQLPLEIGRLGNLSRLDIWNCPGLTELPMEMESLSSLSTLLIVNCPGLTKLPWQIWRLSSLSSLAIEGCEGLTDLGLEMGSSSSLCNLSLTRLVSKLLQQIGNLTSVSNLLIGNFPELIEIPREIGNLTNLSALYVLDCPRLTELPKEIEALSNLSTIYTYGCPGLIGVHTYGKSIVKTGRSIRFGCDLSWTSYD